MTIGKKLISSIDYFVKEPLPKYEFLLSRSIFGSVFNESGIVLQPCVLSKTGDGKSNLWKGLKDLFLEPAAVSAAVQ